MNPNLTYYGPAPMTGSQLADAIAHLRLLRRQLSQTESEYERELDAVLTLDPKRKTQ